MNIVKPTVTYEDHFGDDLKVANAARVSFSKRSDWLYLPDGGKTLRPADRALIAFLARGCSGDDWDNLVWETQDAVFDGEFEDVSNILNHVKRMPCHWAPFAHCGVTLVFKVPLFVARQLGKHQVGFVWSEESRRYIDGEPEFYLPEAWRKKAKNVKQGSSDKVVKQLKHEEGQEDLWGPFDVKWDIHSHTELNLHGCLDMYNALIESDVCPEQARMVLPQNTMVNFWLTGSLYGWSRMAIQRLDPHAQKETRDVVQMVSNIIEPLFPISWKELVK